MVTSFAEIQMKKAVLEENGVLYATLSSTIPTGAGDDFSEITFSGYERQVITFGAIDENETFNTNDITFVRPPTSFTTTASAFGVYDSLTGGNLLFWGSLKQDDTNVSVSYNNNQTVSIGVSGVGFNLTDCI